MNEKTILVLGVGNVLLSDEGVGVHVVKKLNTIGLPSVVEIIDGGTSGYELIDFFRNKKKVIIIDCVNSDEPPGTLLLISPQQLDLLRRQSVSIHQVGLYELLAQAELINPPPEIIILGIVPENIERFSMELSQTLQSALDGIVQKVLNIVLAKSKVLA